MRKLILCVLLCLSIALPSEVRPLSNGTRGLVTALAAIGSGAVSGWIAYEILDGFEKKETSVVVRGVRVDYGGDKVDEIKERYKFKKIWLPAVASIVGAAAGGGITYYALGRYANSVATDKVKSVKKQLKELESEIYVRLATEVYDDLTSKNRATRKKAVEKVVLGGFSPDKVPAKKGLGLTGMLSGAVAAVGGWDYDPVEVFDAALTKYKNVHGRLNGKLKKAKQNGDRKLFKKVREKMRNQKLVMDALRNVWTKDRDVDGPYVYRGPASGVIVRVDPQLKF